MSDLPHTSPLGLGWGTDPATLCLPGFAMWWESSSMGRGRGSGLDSATALLTLPAMKFGLTRDCVDLVLVGTSGAHLDLSAAV